MGGGGHDNLDGGIGDDDIDGQWGHDTIEGGSGDDTIDGGWGHDLIVGGDGNDLLEGSYGMDTLTGGGGADTFVFDEESRDDVVTDFTPGEDMISIDIDGLTYADLTVSETADGLLVAWDGGSALLLGLSGDADPAWFGF